MKKLLLVLVLFFSVGLAEGATLHGNVYDSELNLMENIRVSISTEPEQFIIAKDGSYYFEVGEGEYILKAEYFLDGVLVGSTEEDIKIIDNNDYIIDLVFDFNGEDFSYFWFALMLILFFVVVFLIFWKKKPKEVKEEKNDEDVKKVLEFIKKRDGRVTQKEIRKELLFSESKTSLILTELEHNGKVDRIKKGRANFVILKK